jgi:hypothetical protein
MFNLTNVGLSMCFTVYSDLFLNVMIKCQAILACMFLFRELPEWRGKFVILSHDEKSSL